MDKKDTLVTYKCQQLNLISIAIFEYKLIKRLKKEYRGEAISHAATVELAITPNELKKQGNKTEVYYNDLLLFPHIYSFDTPDGDTQPKQEGISPNKTLGISQSQNITLSHHQNQEFVPLKLDQSSSVGNIQSKPSSTSKKY